LGFLGDRLKLWRYDAHPNLCPVNLSSKSLYSRNPSRDKVEFSVSVRFPKVDYPVVLDLLEKDLLGSNKEFKGLGGNKWDYVKTHLHFQQLKGRRELMTERF
jgi:hypothetical protein